MAQYSNSCDCNDYSLLTANTGIATVSVANSNLDGSGAKALVLTGNTAADGTKIKSIIIKSTGSTLTGMVRLFIANKDDSVIILYREIPIPTYPILAATPTPAIIFPMIEIDLVDELVLNPGFKLYATTQNAQTFNVIAEGLDWIYPGTLPTTCCNFMQEDGNTGIGVISTANTFLDGKGTIVPIFTATSGENGSIIKSITVAAMQSTHQGMVRIFVSPDGMTWTLMMEINVPQTEQSAYVPSYKQVLPEDYYLQQSYIIGASTNNAESFAITIEGVDFSYPIS